MRIGLFHATLPERGRKIGGVEVFVHRLAQRLAASHDVTVLSHSGAPPEARYEHVQLRPAWAGKSQVARMTVVPLRLNRLATQGLDVLHLHGDDWFYLRRDVPTVRTFHGSALFEARYATRWRRRARQLATFPLEALASTLATASYSGGTATPRVYRTGGLLRYGTELSDGADEKSRDPSILFVGTWRGRKRGCFLHELFARTVRPAVPDAELWMVSDDCSPSAGVRWFASPSDEELLLLYRRAWVFCLPSTYEGFGIPYIEAMANGTPVVATPNRGARAILNDGEYGVVVDDAHLANALIEVLVDPGRRELWQRLGRERAREFTWERVVAEHEAAYEGAIARWRQARAT